MNSTKTFKPIVKNGDYLFDGDIVFDRPVEIHFVRIEKFDNPDAFKVLVLSSESNLSLNREPGTSVIHNKHLTEPLMMCVFLPLGMTWIDRGID